MILTNNCYTALWAVKLTVAQQVTVIFNRQKCCFNKQLSNKHTITALTYFPTYQRIIYQYTYRTYLYTSCPVRYWRHHKAVHWLWMNEWILYWLWKQSSCLHKGLLGEHGGDAPFPGLRHKYEILFYQGSVFIEEVGIYVTEGSGKMQVSP